jgi:hypothetical protein
VVVLHCISLARQRLPVGAMPFGAKIMEKTKLSNEKAIFLSRHVFFLLPEALLQAESA